MAVGGARWSDVDVGSNDNDFEEIRTSELIKIEQQKSLYEKRMVNSSERSLRLIDEAQHSAAKTEEELATQEDSLLRTESNLDKINGDLEITNRHLKSMKSIWGSISSYFRRASETLPATSATTAADLQKTEPSRPETSTRGYSKDESLFTERDANKIVNKNLDMMMGGLSELKDHALLMGQTLDRHNEILNRVTYKAEVADTKIEESDKKIRKLLK